MNKNNENIRILIVDDNKDLREIIEEYLKDGGDVTEGADNGKDALQKHNRNPYDLIITDLNMPELTGIELMKTIRKDTDMTEFIIITGYASIDSAVEAIKIGAYDYIVKPFRMEELKVVVKNARDKIKLKKINTQLFERLKSFYNEIERYSQQTGDTETISLEEENLNNTERLVNEIRNLEMLRRSRLFID
ncbi:MAG: response regulator [Syntrophorhabdaceae bacterium]|jgi:DNA-binding NtrC family response regulator|nr:response regulator [Syntrophorhabdaceae bacterium]MDD5245699.1 response regulator [Syntrophorhabdaceae bacterium]